jgi:hypothetical protein
MGSLRAFQGLQGTIGQPTAQVIDGSLKFKGGQYLQRTSTAGNQTTWTWSGWIKVSDLSGNNIFGEDGGYPNASASFNSSGELRFTAAAADSSVFLNVIPSAKFRDFSAWYHFVIVYDSGKSVSSERARIYVNGKRETDLSTATYPSQSATTVVNSNGNVFRIGSHSGVDHLQGYMSNAYLIDGQALGPRYFGFTDPLTGTWRPKRLREGDSSLNDGTTWSDDISGTPYSGSYPVTNAFDGDLSTTTMSNNGGTLTWTPSTPVTGNTIRLYIYAETSGGTPTFKINGVTQTIPFDSSSYSSGWLTFDGTTINEVIWQRNSGTAQVRLAAVEVDGEILTDSAVYAAFGTNGFYLPMDDENRFRLDQSEKNNHFTEAGWSGTSIDPDVVKDSPSGAVFGGRAQTGITTTSSAPSNYCTFNTANNINCTLSEGGLKFVTGGNNSTIWSTMSIPTSGKYCFESTFGGGDMAIMLDQEARRANRNVNQISTGLGMFMYYSTGSSDNRFQSNSTSVSFDSSFTTDSAGDVYMFEVDMDAGTVRVRKDDGSDSGLYTMPDALKAAPLFVGFTVTTTWPAVTQTFNFGQKPFKNTPSQGFLPLNSATVRPNKVVPRPDQYVGVSTYSGDSVEYKRLPLNHQPDLTWIKERGNTRSHILSDTVTGITKHLSTDGNGIQTSPSYPYVSSVDERGIVLRGGTSSGGNVSGRYYVAWTWKAGGNKGTFNVDDVGYATFAASGTAAGDITPTGTSIGTKQGFSIIKYTGSGTSGDTLPHGLLQTPDFIITKCLDASSIDWIVKPVGLLSSESHMLILNGTNASFQGTGGHISAQTSTTVTLTEGSNDGNYNNTGDNYVMYAWHNVPGLQKFGDYVANGAADGNFIELGFRPAILWIKATGSYSPGNWFCHDSERDKFNPTAGSLQLDSNNAEDALGSGYYVDFLSNGFKLRANGNGENGASGNTYIYAAWAEAPASNLFGGQSNAR